MAEWAGSVTGLSSAEVAERREDGRVNTGADVSTRSIKQIILDNVCTLFNLINVIIAIAIFWTGEYKNMLFMGVVICNVVIGIVQEIRSKRTIDRLSVITTPRAHVIRDGEEREIALGDIVIDDVLRLERGDQVPSDCRIIEGICSANESLLTGEQDPIVKNPGDELLSGSFIGSGTCIARVIAVGADNYATRINNEAKVFKKVESGIMEALNRIVKWVTIAIFPLGAALILKETFSDGGELSSAILHASAALIGMIPQGLVLLTSTVLAISVFRLGQHRVLVQELYCVETLARVDTICLDKTGTITTGELEVDEIVPFTGVAHTDAVHALFALDVLMEADQGNATIQAIHKYLAGIKMTEGEVVIDAETARIIPFSSDRKYSGVVYGSDEGNYCLGAAEFVLSDSSHLAEAREMIEQYAGVRRVLVVVQVEDFDADNAIIGEVHPLALVFIHDCIRPTAVQTLKYFTDQGVRINIISGDSVETVSSIAKSVGVPDADACIDMSTVTDDAQLVEAARSCRVFGRVSPDQKKKLVEALKRQGHTVAMTGDGVNDVLALHVSDCSVAMGSGAAAARNIAQLVLVDDDFASMPAVVAEGRRAINNLQRSGSLFLVKTIFSAFLAIAFIFILAFDYPFITIQLTLFSSMCIALPSFVLALEPNKDRIRGDFLRNVVTKALPGAVMVILAVLISVIVGYIAGFSQEQFSTMCLILTMTAGVNLVFRISVPFTPVRIALFVVVLAGLVGGCLLLPGLFQLTSPTTVMVVSTVVLMVLITLGFNWLYAVAERVERGYLERVAR